MSRRTTSRIATLGLLLALFLLLGSGRALAWENGGNENNGFGTHDWILDNAITLAGEEGDWVDWKTAMLATDDPDSYNWSITYHLYYESGSRRGAPQEVASLYYKAVRAYQSGDRQKASLYVGRLSHYYADICQPFHSTKTALKYKTTTPSYHKQYEQGVGPYLRHPGDRPSWLTPRERKEVTSVRDKTIAAARYARGKFPTLIADFKVNKRVTSKVTSGVTHDVLSRASNDLADLIAAIPAQQGVAHAPATLRVSMYRQFPAQNAGTRADVYCLDDDGAPMEGVKVVFKWSLKSGTKYTAAYTDSNGYAYYWLNVGSSPLMRQTTVTARATSSGQTTSASTWFMATPKLDAGSDGIKTTLSSYAPYQNSDVSARTAVHDLSGRPVVGLPVTFTWAFKTGTVTYQTVTDSSGIARHTSNIGNAEKGYRVYVRAQVQSAGINRSSTSSFVPK